MTQEPATSVTWNRRVWTVIGLAVIAVGLWYLGSFVSGILTPVVLALFPAALLHPLTSRLRRTRIPNAIVALLALLLLLAVLAGAIAFVTAALVDQWPQLVESVTSGLDQLEENVDWAALPGDFQGLSDVLTQAGSALASGGLLASGAGAVTSFVTGLVLLIVTLFFYFKDGRRIWNGFLEFVPARHQPRVDLVAAQCFWTVGAYFRAQLIVALVDAVFIGLGLWLLGVPLVLPLSVLVFIGGLFPIVGAFVSGFVAVVVALADQGIGTALLALAVVLLVQQLEGNVLEPYIQGRTIVLHPLLIILAVTAGGVLMGILGAFLAVPVAAVIARLVDNLRGRPFPSGPGSRQDEPADTDDGEAAEAASS